MNDDIKLMIEKYGTYETDWLNDKINSYSELTKHHIIKKEKGGINDISNFALLTTNSHRLIHYLEDKYYKDYVSLNNLFLELNRSEKPPTIEYYDNIKRIIKRVKKCIKNENKKRKK